MTRDPDRVQRSRWMDAMVRRWEGALVAYARRFVGAGTARDVVQETFLGIWRSAATTDLSEIERMRGYVYKTCRNRCVDVMRAQRGSDGLVEPVPAGFAPREEPLPDAWAEARQELRQVLERLRGLPTRDQEILRLKFVDGLSYSEISDVVGVPVGTVGWVLHEALSVVKAGGR